MRTNLEILLGDWGRWKVIQDDEACGLPREAAFTKERVDNGSGYDSDFIYAPLVDDDVRRVDQAILHLHPDYRVVLVAHYKWAGPVKVKLDTLGLSRTAYFDTLKFCHSQLSHDMGGRYMCGYETKSSGLIAA
jgi:hypothetical protein